MCRADEGSIGEDPVRDGSQGLNYPREVSSFLHITVSLCLSRLFLYYIITQKLSVFMESFAIHGQGLPNTMYIYL
jgi:hypothetical protein